MIRHYFPKLRNAFGYGPCTVCGTPYGPAANSIECRAPVADSYEPADVETAWSEYRTAHPEVNRTDGYQVFRAGYRRGFSTGGLVAAGMTVHTRVADPEGGDDG